METYLSRSKPQYLNHIQQAEIILIEIISLRLCSGDLIVGAVLVLDKVAFVWYLCVNRY